MQSKNKAPMTAAERRHVDQVKQLACSVCDTPGPSDAHEIKQGQWFTAIAVCRDCHLGAHNGWHGQKRMWAVKRMDELDALAVTLRRLFALPERLKT